MDNLNGVDSKDQRRQDPDPVPHPEKAEERESEQPRRDGAHRDLHGHNGWQRREGKGEDPNQIAVYVGPERNESPSHGVDYVSAGVGKEQRLGIGGELQSLDKRNQHGSQHQRPAQSGGHRTG